MEMFYRFSLKKFNNDVEDESDRLCLQGFFLDALLEEPHWRGRNSEEFSSQDQKDICWKRPRPPCWWLHFQKNNIKKKISPVSSQLVKNQKKKCATLYLIERYLIERVARSLHQSWTAIRSECKQAAVSAAVSFLSSDAPPSEDTHLL